MKKETGIAIFFGLAAGALIALGLIFFNSRSNASGGTDVTDNPQITPVIKTTQQPTILTIQSPLDKTIVDSDSIEIKGLAEKQSVVVVQGPGNEQVVKAESGSFTATMNLRPGSNRITITQYKNKAADTRTLDIYYIEKE